VRSGNVSTKGGMLRVAGNSGYEWSSRASSAHASSLDIPSAYHFYFNTTDTHSSSGPWERWVAFPLRCLSTVLGM